MTLINPTMSPESRAALTTIMQVAEKLMTPTLSQLEPLISQWAHDKGIMTAANPVGQMDKTAEEVGEARMFEAAIELVRRGIALNASTVGLWDLVENVLPPKDCKKVVDLIPGLMTADNLMEALKHLLALELGDILVTLCIQAEMQGFTLSSILPYDINVYDENDNLREWDNVDYFVSELSAAVVGGSKLKIITGLISVYTCVRGIAQLGLEMTPEECIALAYEKIKGRSGYMNEAGQFVKVGD